jgi:hypothetical protein
MSAKSNLQNANKWSVVCDTELIPTKPGDRSMSKVPSILTRIKKLWQNTISALTREPELTIWQKQDRSGHIHWHIYDPLTGKSLSFASELEMLRWIEHFYSRNCW